MSNVDNIPYEQTQAAMIVRLATSGDIHRISELRSACERTPSEWPESTKSNDEFVPWTAVDGLKLVAVHRSTGKVVAAATAAVASTERRLIERIGYPIDVTKETVPAIAVTNCLALPGGGGFLALLLEIVKVAGHMRHPKVGPIQSVAVLNKLPPQILVFTLFRMGFSIQTPRTDVSDFSTDSGVGLLLRERFIETSVRFDKEIAEGQIPSHKWEGPRLSPEHLP